MTWTDVVQEVQFKLVKPSVETGYRWSSFPCIWSNSNHLIMVVVSPSQKKKYINIYCIFSKSIFCVLLTMMRRLRIMFYNFSENKLLPRKKGQQQRIYSNTTWPNNRLYHVNDGLFPSMLSQPPIWWMNTLCRPNSSTRASTGVIDEARCQ